jgi:hypothetical protein
MENILFTAVVRCDKCGTVGPTASCKVSPELYGADEVTKQKAIELWNKRSVDTELFHVGYSNGKLTALVNVQSKLKELAATEKETFRLSDITDVIAKLLED